MTDDLSRATREVGRYHLRYLHPSGKGGHIITVEKLSDSSIRIYDPQTVKTIEWRNLRTKIKLSTGVSIYRVDNLHINPQLIDGAVIASED